MSDERDNVILIDFAGRSQQKKEEPIPPAPPEKKTQKRRDEPISITISFEHRKKLTFFKEGLSLGIVMLTLDTRREGVVVPSQYKGYPNLSLNFCYDYHIQDFAFDDTGVRASLSFGGVDHWCNVPWPSVYAIRHQTNGKSEVFIDSVPPEYLS